MNLAEFLNDPVYFRLLASAGLGALIGLERQLAGKDPSLRTFALISMGSCCFSILSESVTVGSTHADPGRIAAQILPGIGFLGAGTIFRGSRGISGLTTAALMWVTAAIGMAVGFGRIDVATATTLTAVFITFSLKLVHKTIQQFRPNTQPKSNES